METLYALPNHPVFQLVPALFHARADGFYENSGRPIITSNNFWDVYRDILAQFQRSSLDAELETVLRTASEQQTAAFDDDVPVLPNMMPFRCGAAVMRRENQDQYMGGLTASGSTSNVVQDERRYADLTTDDEDNDDDGNDIDEEW
jgi:hypothetical protein